MEDERRLEGVWNETDSPGAGPAASPLLCLERHGKQLWRLFFIQSSRNDRTVDGLGFFSIVSPLIRSWAPAGDAAREIARRHLAYFNANSIVASFVAGAVVNLETRRARGDRVAAEEIDRVKSALSSALSARGNHFFETVLIPLGLTIACIFAMYSSYVGLLIFLALYNIYHFQARIGGYCAGAERGEGAAEAFITRLFGRERFFGNCAAFASGVFAALLFVKARATGGAGFVTWGAAAMTAAMLLRRRFSPARGVTVLFAATVFYLIARWYLGAASR
jgi:hypothetical protein